MKKILIDGFEYFVDIEKFVVDLYEMESLTNLVDIVPVSMRGKRDYYAVDDKYLKKQALKELCEDDKIVEIIALKVKESYLENYDSVLEELYQYINNLLPSFSTFAQQYIKDEELVEKIVKNVKRQLKT